MPAKKKATKKKEVEKLDLSKPLDVENASKAQRKDYAAFLEQLKVTAGWKILERVMDDNLQIIANQIVEKQGVDGRKLEDIEVDELRIQYNQIKQLKGLPDQLIEQFLPEEDQPEVQYDPYSATGLGSNVLSMSDTT